jgi:hypothetical protein
MVIIIIRRFIRADREQEFLAKYQSQSPTQNRALKEETLTKVSEESKLPARLRSFTVNGPACMTYLNIAKWESWEDFAKQF